MAIRVHPQVVKLFLGLIQPPKNAQLFSNCLDTWHKGGLAVVNDNDLLLTGITTKPSVKSEAEEVYEQRMSVLQTNDPHFYDPTDQFHIGFAAYDFGEQQEFLPVQDKLMIWKCSEHDPQRMAAGHLIGIEGMLSAMLVGGYFGVVLPKKWLGKQMTYMRWWQDHCATVARVKLPPGAVKWYDGLEWAEGLPAVRFGIHDNVIDPKKQEEHIKHESLEQEWQLVVFHRPAVYGKRTPRSEPLARVMPFAEFRFTPFIFPLETLENKDIDSCTKKFFRHDWWRNSVSLWRDMLAEHTNHSILGTYRTKAFGLNEQQEFWIFNPSQKSQHIINIVPKASDLVHPDGKPKDIRGVQIKFGTSVRLTPCGGKLGYYAIGALLDLKSQLGMEKNQDGEMVFAFDQVLYRKSFSEVRDEVIERIYEVGLVPYMTENDHHRMQKQERWLSIQLTPTERTVHVGAKTEEEQLADPGNWEKMYEDIGLKATFPELVEMWRKRALGMGIQKFTNDFQFNDVIYLATRQSQVLGDVPGLGKTRQALFASILRCARRVLIICPGKLIDTWQDEIRDTIVPFARMQKRDWQGNVIDPTINVITQGRDLLLGNLARFNIIGIDKLKETPRDGRFYKCPVCGTVAFCKNQDAVMTCPGDANLEEDDPKRCSMWKKAWENGNQRQDERPALRKYRIVVNDLGETVLKVNGTKYPIAKAWEKKFNEPFPRNFPLEIKTVDERPVPKAIPIMEPQDNMYAKMKRLQIGMEEHPVTGVQRPIYKMVKRPFHAKWTFAELVRWRFPFAIADELHYIANEESKRSQSVQHVTAASRIGLTGTPMKGYPEKILPLLNWTFDRPVFPDYRDYDPEGIERFKKKYELVVHIDATELADGSMTAGQKKRLPKINNAELFQNEMSSLIIRRIRNEPEVTACIPPYRIKRERVNVPMDEQHKEYYRKWLKVFAEWWAEMKREKEGRNVQQGNVLTKLTYLANASFIPHFMLDPILEGKDEEGVAWAKMIGKYKGPPVAKMKHAWKLVRAAKELGEKSLVFSYRTKNSDLGHHWSVKNGINSMWVDGRIPIKAKAGMDRSERHLLVQQFRTHAYDVMWAGTTALAEGMNIPEANHGIVLDATWDDVGIRQAIGRMLRIQQQRSVYATYLMHHGAIDSYMFALSELKARSADEAIDFMQFDDFHVGMVPDIKQYADAIVDGTEDVLARKMWTSIDFMTKKEEEEGDYGQASD